MSDAKDYFVIADCITYDDISGYLSCPCYLEGSLFTRVGAGVATEDSAPDVEIRLLNTLIGNSPETMSLFAQISNINEEVAAALACSKLQIALNGCGLLNYK